MFPKTAAEDSEAIRLRFTDFMLEEARRGVCVYDYVIILPGKVRMQKFSGTDFLQFYEGICKRLA